jgi:triosephosphate isomerase
MRDRTLLIGNWKMNLTVGEASLYVHKLNKEVQTHRNVEISLAPTTLCLQPLSLQIDHKKFSLTAQNLYWRDEGAYTGEVSAHQLHGLVKYAIIGHSERRHVFHEHERDIRAKVQAAVRNRITPVLCVGETALEKSEGESLAVLHDQIVGGLANLTAEEVAEMVIAYEPVWAISAGKDFSHHATPTAGDVAAMVKGIRNQVEHLFGKKTAKSVRVIYGGSASSENAAELLSVHDLDGLLPGGASLRLEEFTKIVELAHERRK